MLNIPLEEVKNYSELLEGFDAAFVDPPYLDAVRYIDLSIPMYLIMKYLVEMPPIEEILDKDVTAGDEYAFYSKLKKNLEGLYEILKDDAIAVLQFAPRKSKDPLRIRAYVIAAAIEAGFVPVLAYPVFLESQQGGERGKRGDKTKMTALIYLLKADPIEILDEIGLGDIAALKDLSIEDMIRLFLDSDYYRKASEYVKDLAIEFIPIFIYSLLGPLLYYLIKIEGRFRGYRLQENLNRIIRAVNEEYARKVLEVLGEDLVKALSKVEVYDDITPLYLMYASGRGAIELRYLSSLIESITNKPVKFPINLGEAEDLFERSPERAGGFIAKELALVYEEFAKRAKNNIYAGIKKKAPFLEEFLRAFVRRKLGDKSLINRFLDEKRKKPEYYKVLRKVIERLSGNRNYQIYGEMLEFLEELES